MKLIIAGGRDYVMTRTDIRYLDAIKDEYQIDEVVHGAARGADTCGKLWAESRCIPVRAFPANWRPNGLLDRSAGMKRNREMAKYVRETDDFGGALAVFPGGAGTMGMVKIATSLGMLIFNYMW